MGGMGELRGGEHRRPPHPPPTLRVVRRPLPSGERWGGWPFLQHSETTTHPTPLRAGERSPKRRSREAGEGTCSSNHIRRRETLFDSRHVPLPYPKQCPPPTLCLHTCKRS